MVSLQTDMPMIINRMKSNQINSGFSAPHTARMTTHYNDYTLSRLVRSLELAIQ